MTPVMKYMIDVITKAMKDQSPLDQQATIQWTDKGMVIRSPLSLSEGLHADSPLHIDFKHTAVYKDASTSISRNGNETLQKWGERTFGGAWPTIGYDEFEGMHSYVNEIILPRILRIFALNSAPGDKFMPAFFGKRKQEVIYLGNLIDDYSVFELVYNSVFVIQDDRTYHFVGDGENTDRLVSHKSSLHSDLSTEVKKRLSLFR